MFVVKCTGRGLVVKRPGALSKVQMLNLVLGVGVFSLRPKIVANRSTCYRGRIGAEIGGGDAMKQKSVKRSASSPNEGKAFSERRLW